MLDGQYLYEMWVEEMESCSTDPFDSWSDLNIAVQQAWDRLAGKVESKIERWLGEE